jgi:predicted metalloendopeptidase
MNDRLRMHTTRAAIAAVLLLAGAAVSAQLKSGLDVSTIDRSVRPQDDLFAHVNGAWLQRTAIAPDRRRAGVFDEVADRISEQLRAIAEQPGRIGTFYATFMDEAAAERQGLRPLASELAAVEAIGSRADLARVFARLTLLEVRTPVTPIAVADPERPSVFALVIRQGGLGLPNREYYVTDGAAFADIRVQYASYLATLLDMSGTASARDAARTIVALETALARGQWTAAQSRDVIRTHNPMPAADIAQRYPGLDWSVWRTTLGIPDTATTIVNQPSYLEALSSQIETTPLEAWKLYLRAAVLDRYAPYLAAPFVDAEFAFRGRVLGGVQQPEPRWRRAITALNASMGHAVAEAYVGRHFPPESRARMARLIENLRTAFGEAIDRAEWMGPSTRQEARRKLAAFRANIGYPPKWRDYTGLDVRDGDLAGNMMRAAAFERQYQLRRIGGATDPDEWTMLPQIVNASYNARRNAITFPAGILQPPLFDPDADDAVNYGGIGSVIGHEMGHGFDDQGRRSDALGRLRDWWTAADAAAYERRAAQIAAQFDAYDALPGLKVNGALTLGENIGDLTGLVIALRAYHLSLGGRPAPVIDGMTGDQRFFAGWAQAFRRKLRDEALRELVLTDPHSPPNFRVNGPVVNMPEFYEAFGVTPGDRMFVPPDRRVRIW